MRILSPGELQHADLARALRRETHMAAFRGQRHPAVFHGNQAGNTQAGAGADQADDASLARYTAADLAQLPSGQEGQAHGEGGEVVDHQQGIEAHRLARRFYRELPAVVGHAHQVACHRVGNGYRAMAHRLCTALELHLRKVVAQRRQEVRIGIATQCLPLLEHPCVPLDRKARESRANVGQQAGFDRGHRDPGFMLLFSGIRVKPADRRFGIAAKDSRPLQGVQSSRTTGHAKRCETLSSRSIRIYPD